MPTVTANLQEAARISIPRIEARLAPAPPTWTAGAVATLLTHFYTADLPKAVYAAINADWVACLSGFPEWAIEKARVDWLKTDRRKPTPADIVKLCNRAVSKERAALYLCQRIIASPLGSSVTMTAEKREAARLRVGEMVADLARSLRTPRTQTGAAGQIDPP